MVVLINYLDWVVDETTGEILANIRRGDVKVKMFDTNSFRSASDVVHYLGSRDKVRFTNLAMPFIVECGLTPFQQKAYLNLCQMLVNNNIIIADLSDLSEEMGVSSKNVSALLIKFHQKGLIFIHKRNVSVRGRYFLYLNPSIVWAGWFHGGGKDIKTGLHYSSTSYFSRPHKDAVQSFLNMQGRERADRAGAMADLNLPTKG